MKRIAVALFTAALIIAPRARAADCRWRIDPTNVNFGTYSVFGTGNLTATSTYQIRCDGVIGTVKLSRGAAPTYSPRLVTRTVAPTATIGYNLYMDAARTMIWGDGTSGTQFPTYDTIGMGNTFFDVTIYGSIPLGADVRPGTYNDTIQATLAWTGGNSDARFFTVTTTVAPECTVSTTAVNFGAYDPLTANATTPKDSTGTVNVFCTIGTIATVSLDLGLNAVGATRRMAGPAANFLNYELYKDAGRTVVWNTVNTNSGTSTSKLVAINGGFIAYGRVPAAQDVGVGSYSDTVLVTVNY
jgi:spore coat protein U-like protein